VELIAEVEGEREVVVGERIFVTDRQAADLVRVAAEVVEEPVSDRAAGTWQVGREPWPDECLIICWGDEERHAMGYIRPYAGSRGSLVPVDLSI
jgi:hypothetical protein